MLTPKRLIIGDDQVVVHAAPGCYHTVVCTAAGEVWVFGNPSSGALGLGSSSSSVNSPVRVSGELATKKVVFVSVESQRSGALTDTGEAYLYVAPATRSLACLLGFSPLLTMLWACFSL